MIDCGSVWCARNDRISVPSSGVRALSVQNGVVTEPPPALNATPRYLRTQRDLAWYLFRDISYQPYYHAALILLGAGAPWSPTLPYTVPAGNTGAADAPWRNQTNFLDLGVCDLLDVIARVSTLALRAAWFFKWSVHLRLRPEVMAMLLERTLRGEHLGLHADLLASETLAEVLRRNDQCACLPMAYHVGSPAHSSFPGGHACLAAACTTVLKAFFDETHVLAHAYVPTDDGLALRETADRLTVRDELDKLASCCGLGRDAAGVHYRSDESAAFALGEQVALRLLEDLVPRYAERRVRFRLHLRDGRHVQVDRRGVRHKE